MERLERMVAHGPIFGDITWGAGGTTADVTLDIAIKMQNTVGKFLTELKLTIMEVNMGQACDADLRGDYDASDLHQHAQGQARLCFGGGK